MGNNSSQPAHAEALDSRVIKISESVAQRLLVQRETPGRIITLEAPQSGSLQKPFRRDPSVIGEEVYQEFEKHDVINELQMKSLSKRLATAAEAFDKAPVAVVKSSNELTEEQSKVLSCLKSNDGAGLNCHADIVEFVSFVENNTYPVAAQ